MVALRKESVDRNFSCSIVPRTENVALRKESVDRNAKVEDAGYTVDGSLSARRAWIEMQVKNDCPSIRGGRSPQGERG